MKKAVLFLAEGFEEIEALGTVDILRRADIQCDICALEGQLVKGSHDIIVKADMTLENCNEESYDAILLHGGMPGAKNLKENKILIEKIRKCNERGQIIGAICAAPIVLKEADIIQDRKITSYPGYEGQLEGCIYTTELVEVDRNIITSRGPSTMMYFALEIVTSLCGQEAAETLKKAMLLDITETKIKNRE